MKKSSYFSNLQISWNLGSSIQYSYLISLWDYSNWLPSVETNISPYIPFKKGTFWRGYFLFFQVGYVSSLQGLPFPNTLSPKALHHKKPSKKGESPWRRARHFFFSGWLLWLHSWRIIPFGCFQKIGVPQNGWFKMKNPIKMDDLGVALFSETSI